MNYRMIYKWRAVRKYTVPAHLFLQAIIRYILQMAHQWKYTVTWKDQTVEEREVGQEWPISI